MIIAGGTYREHVDSSGHSEDLAGSGFRAAMLLAGGDIEFVSAIDESTYASFDGAVEVLGITSRTVGRDRPVGFHYRAPFLEPALRGGSARLSSPLEVLGDQALVFGMVERGQRRMDVSSLVYDPQSVEDVLFTSESRPWARNTRLVLCANVAEVRAISGLDDVEAAARSAAKELEAEVVITKAGGRGCLVTDRVNERQTWVGCYPTAIVSKVGSGDVFSGALAHAWHRGANAIDAARFASATTAWWCGGNGVKLSGQALAGELPETGASELRNAGAVPRVYLAGPFFTTEQRWLIDQCKLFLESAGATVFSPVHEIGLGGPEVAEADLAGLGASDSVFAILDGWDPGTLFETGWATARGIPVVTAGGISHAEGATMLVGTGAEQHADFTTAMYRAIWKGLSARGY
ncbi:hypothetical protein PlfCFBP13513_17095 [Plantibacter flavus]|uniref:PfkB family carbohydrate kinase n=1 Tax=Plantibacter flavus TaxID=150123 RepID=UPI0010C22897|nr:PfkB family carbohydrate kinase [Plantibacter flavus]TKJ95541.1 hypothetical protein PlfCFBP13513_17095 [Plantibacter flavus]